MTLHAPQARAGSPDVEQQQPWEPPRPRRRAIDRLGIGAFAVVERLFVLYAFVLLSAANIPPVPGAYELDPSASGGGSAYAPIYLVAGLLALLRPSRFVRAAVAHRPSLVLLVFAVASVAWSDAPSETIRRSIAIVGTSIFAWYLVSRYTTKDILLLAAYALGLTAVLSLVYGVLRPDLAMIPIDDGSWRGVYENKNVLGRAMVLSAIVFLLLNLEPDRKRWFTYAGVGVSVLMMLMSQSKTALVVLVVLAILLRFSATLRLKLTALVPVIVLAILVVVGGAIWLQHNAASAAASLGKDASMTGRTDLWAVAVDMILRRPLLGYGYGAFWRGWEGASGAFWAAVGWPTPHSHNGFLDLALDLGLVGLAIAVAGFGTAYARAVALARTARTAGTIAPLIIISYVLFYNLTESALLKNNTLVWVLFLVATSTACGGSFARNES